MTVDNKMRRHGDGKSSCVFHHELNPCHDCALEKEKHYSDSVLRLESWVRANAGVTGVNSVDETIECDGCGGKFKIKDGGFISDVLHMCSTCSPHTKGNPCVGLHNRYE